MDNITHLNSIDGGKSDGPTPTEYTIGYNGPDGYTEIVSVGYLTMAGGMTMVITEDGSVLFATNSSLVYSIVGKETSEGQTIN